MNDWFLRMHFFIVMMTVVTWGRVPLFAADAGQSRLEISVVDAAGRLPLPCRVHILDAAGKPHRPEGVPFWKDHFVCDGKAVLNVPSGIYTVEIEHGPEYQRVNRSFDLAPGETGQFATELNRIADLASQGWLAGDLHVHRSVEDILRLMQAEDLHVAPVITWWNNRNLWADRPLPKETTVFFEGGRHCHVMAGEDEREGGALLFFGLKKPLPITGAAREYPSSMKFVEMARAQSNAWIDIEKPFWWDVPVWLACAKVDSIGIANNHMCRSSMYENEAWGKPRDTKRLPAPRGNGYWSQEIYYHILNCGLRIPPSAGSASGVLPNPVGYNRVYVYTRSESVHNAENEKLWWDGLKAGRSFVTNEPLLVVRADDHVPGHVFRAAPGGKIEIPLRMSLTTQEDIRAIEIVQNGQVVRSVPCEKQGYTTDYSAKLTVDSSGWFLIRAIADNQRTFRFASTAPFYVEIGDVKNRVSRKSAKLFLDWVNERAQRVGLKLKDPEPLREVLVYHDRARAFWQNLVDNANSE